MNYGKRKFTADAGTDLTLCLKRIKKLCMAGEGTSFEAVKLLCDLEESLESFIVSTLAVEMREAENA